MMKKIINIIAIICIMMLYNLKVTAQADVLNHFRVNSFYVGWDNTGTSGSLDIKNDFSQPINFFTNSSASPYMTILGSTNPGFVGIGTATPNNTLEINSGLAANSLPRRMAGLRLARLTSGSSATNDITPYGRVLTVDANGEVGLTTDAGIVATQNATSIAANGAVEWGGSGANDHLIHNTQIQMVQVPNFQEYSIYFTGQTTMTNGTPANRVNVGIGYPFASAALPLLAKLDVINETHTIGSYRYTNQYAGRFIQTGDYSVTNPLGNDDHVGIYALSDVRHLAPPDRSTNIGGDFYATNGYFNNIGARGTATALINGTEVRAIATSTISAIGVDTLASGGTVANVGVTSVVVPAAGAINFGIYAGAVTGGVPPAGSVNIAVYGDLLGNPLCTNPLTCPGYAGSAPDFAGYFDGDLLTTSNLYALSDANLKSNIQTFSNAMDIISQLQPKSYTFNQQANMSMIMPAGNRVGLLAQDVFNVLPQLTKDCIHPARRDSAGNITHAAINYKAVNYIELIPYLIAGIKQQQEQITNLETLVEELSNPIPNLIEPQEGDGGNDDSGSSPASQAIGIDVTLSSKSIVLNQNVPNPFKEQTTIEYFIPDDAEQVKIIFTDNKGAVLKEVEISEKGKGQLNVYAADLSSGIYTYTIVADGITIDTKQMVKSK